LFANLANGLKTGDDAETASEVAEAQMKLGLPDAAREQIARFLGELTRQTVGEQIPRQVLGAVFPKRGDEAWTWWTFFRQKFPQDDPAATMRRVRTLLDPAGPLAVYLHGRMLEKLGRTDEGRQRLDHARWLPLGNTTLRADLAADLAKRGHDDLAARERDLVMKLGWPRVWSEGGLLSA